MLVIQGRNVNDIYAQARRRIREIGVPSGSRAGAVLAAPHPVMSVYDKPTERVLWDSLRDSNPFFSLLESIWLLAGRDDGAWLDLLISDFSKRFSEKGGRIHGSYGMRWRNHWDVDQLTIVVERFRRDNNDRRVVVSMWDPDHDLWSQDQFYSEHEKNADYVEPRDLPCNTHLYPRIVDGRLDLTVLCRSNDIIFGAYGANAVHFSVFQEYLAAAIGVGVGKMYQFSNNWHAYVDILEKTEPEKIDGVPDAYEDLYLDMGAARVPPLPMVEDQEHFLEDCERFCDNPSSLVAPYYNPWFTTTAVPMYAAAGMWRLKDVENARRWASEIQALDWRAAALRWMDRRIRNREQT